MPRLSGKKWLNSRKENNDAMKRLMEISLKVDDYVYKQKLISERDAEIYIQEVSSYKLMCSQDVRSLQVIDKLTRCMKGIIAEHQELNKSDRHSRNGGTSSEEMASQFTPTSPVYSLPDEDKTHLTQTNIVTDEVNTNVIETNDVNIRDLSIYDNINIDPTIQAEQERINDADTKQDNPSLSLEKSEVLQESKNIIENCSQSILNNHENTEIRLLNSKESCINENREVNMEPVNDTSILSVENIFANIDPGIAKPLIMEASNDKTLNVNNRTQKSADSKVKIKRNATPRKKKIDTKVKENVINKKTRKKSSKKTSTKGTAKESVEYTSDETSKFVSNKHKDGCFTDTVNPKVNVTSPANIYNENIENDLSWIENIRYVREVSTKEFDPKLANVDQGFWDNFSLPHFWDDQDFAYSP